MTPAYSLGANVALNARILKQVVQLYHWSASMYPTLSQLGDITYILTNVAKLSMVIWYI